MLERGSAGKAPASFPGSGEALCVQPACPPGSHLSHRRENNGPAAHCPPGFRAAPPSLWEVACPTSEQQCGGQAASQVAQLQRQTSPASGQRVPRVSGMQHGCRACEKGLLPHTGPPKDRAPSWRQARSSPGTLPNTCHPTRPLKTCVDKPLELTAFTAREARDPTTARPAPPRMLKHNEAINRHTRPREGLIQNSIN